MDELFRQGLGAVGVVELITGMLRVKNEARWIREVVESLKPVCKSIFVLDDHSDDGTPDICRELGAVVFESPFEGFDEVRDKSWLLEQISAMAPEWILCIDGDEVLLDQEMLLQTARNGRAPAYSLRILYVWDVPNQIRTDGVYGRFFRQSLFRYSPGLRWADTRFGGNFHCSNVPQSLHGSCEPSTVKLLHYGYMHAADRARKFAWYNTIDPDNRREDCYRHMIQGDHNGPPSDAKLLHAGPLKLEQL